MEADHIHRVLLGVDGNKTRAAQILGIDRKTLRLKLRRSDPCPISVQNQSLLIPLGNSRLGKSTAGFGTTNTDLNELQQTRTSGW